MAIVREHSGAYGMGVDYAYTMVHKAPERTTSKHEPFLWIIVLKNKGISVLISLKYWILDMPLPKSVVFYLPK
jgi:hypothetical protein